MLKTFVEFSLMVGCPNKCKFCPQETHLKAYTGVRMLSMDNYTKMIDKLSKSVISIAGFSEPFMNPNCIDMIEYANNKHHDIIIYTTLQGMTLEIYERLRRLRNVKGLTIHLPDSEGNAIIPVTEEYKKLLRFILYNGMASCQTTFSVHGKAVHKELIPIINIIPQYRIHDRAGCLKTDDKTVHKVHWISGAIRCGNGFAHPESGIVIPNGNVFLCCMDFGLEYKLGNLLEQEWSDIMKSPLRKRMKEDRETGCHNEICRYCAEAILDYRG